MSKNDSQHLRPVLMAALGASFLMLIFGVTYRTLAARLAAPSTAPPIPSEIFAGFPVQIGDWTGEDVPLDEAIVRTTDTDAHINRRYWRPKGLESVSLYVGCGVRTWDMMAHRPEVCYIGAGWTRTGRESLELPLRDGTILPCLLFEFSRGTLNTEKVVVLYYYIVDGQYCRDLSEWQYHFWRIGHVAQVQIVASKDALAGSAAVDTVSAFAADSAFLIAERLSRIESHQSVDPTNVGQ